MVEKDEAKEHIRTREFEGNTVEEAISNALDELNLHRDKIKIHILTEGQRGLFGMQGAKKAKIQVSILADDAKT
ncbi:MAG: Jag N-terminal domain-containing protein [Candidatus Omnitrophica bacterium]|nr:Jag N-terminal domain-containing protein [Candidatus Omnitrophota bacterium]MBU4479687.1 Jag N-terminal domain-containing protein [Candidatus Omnitrophota bacterium]MCG2703111.1 Jag N-terminal domain-containing protein [Candidatus Omnitrophota bacterium]